MPTYRVTFENNRLGRNHEQGPLYVSALDYGGIAGAVYGAVRPRLMSSDVEVLIDQREDEDEAVGMVFAGLFTVGRFAVEEVDRVPAG